MRDIEKEIIDFIDQEYNTKKVLSLWAKANHHA
ncbi:putative cytoplasmic protein [Salmonella sp. NCTC 11881]|nr:putative cytoplasmic protein [Salmonella sp. NCTC 11881]